MTAALVQLQCLPQAAGSRRKRIFFFTFLWVIAEAADLSAIFFLEVPGSRIALLVVDGASNHLLQNCVIS